AGQLLGELGRRLGRTSHLALAAGHAAIAAGHVLPNQEAELIAPVIPALRLNLDMLAGQIETELLGDFDVIAKRFIRRRGVEPIGPETLIERADLEDELAVEEHPRDALIVFADLDFSHAEVTLNCV